MPTAMAEEPLQQATPSLRPEPKTGEHDDGLAAFAPVRARLFGIAYRMLGSVADAEDALQDAFIRWQRASETEVRSPKAFLVTIVSRVAGVAQGHEIKCIHEHGRHRLGVPYR